MTSNWPASQDNDTTLGRYISTDAVVPNCFNNYTDAIEAMQATLQPVLGAPSGTAGQVLAINNPATPTYQWVAPGGGGSIADYSVYISAPVSLTTTFADVCTLAVPAGTYVIMLQAVFSNDGTLLLDYFRVTDGTTTYVSGWQLVNFDGCAQLVGIAVLASSATLHFQAQVNTAGHSSELVANTLADTTDVCTGLVALKIA